MASFNDKFDSILLDLDGTLVDSPKNRFLLYNTIALYRRFIKLFGYTRTVGIVRKSIFAVLNNESEQVNFSVLVNTCHQLSGVPIDRIQSELDSFYHNDFLNWSSFFTPVPGAKEFIVRAKAKGKSIYICTNPIWPEFNVRKRLEWAGFQIEDFSGFTHSQNISGCKPNTLYFKNALKLFSLNPAQCVLIGDSEYKDGPARHVGIETIILSQNKATSWMQLTERL
jgi:FMN phosphatase YigB (HAD superfamily)